MPVTGQKLASETGIFVAYIPVSVIEIPFFVADIAVSVIEIAVSASKNRLRGAKMVKKGIPEPKPAKGGGGQEPRRRRNNLKCGMRNAECGILEIKH